MNRVNLDDAYAVRLGSYLFQISKVVWEASLRKYGLKRTPEDLEQHTAFIRSQLEEILKGLNTDSHQVGQKLCLESSECEFSLRKEDKRKYIVTDIKMRIADLHLHQRY